MLDAAATLARMEERFGLCAFGATDAASGLGVRGGGFARGFGGVRLASVRRTEGRVVHAVGELGGG